MSAYVPQVGDEVRVGKGAVRWEVSHVRDDGGVRLHRIGPTPWKATDTKYMSPRSVGALVLVKAASQRAVERNAERALARQAEEDRLAELRRSAARIRAELPVEPQDTPHRVVGVMVDVADLRALLAEVRL